MTQASVFDCPKPAFSDARIAAMLLSQYGLVGELSPLVSERDQNLKVRSATGDFVLKIANAAEAPMMVELQNAVLRHLESVDIELGVPRVIAALGGSDAVTIEAEGVTHRVRLLSFLPGTLFSAVPKTPTLLSNLGNFMGRLSRALQGFGHPATHRSDFLWNLDTVLQVEPWVEDVAIEHRAMVARVFARYRARVLPQLHKLRAAIVHQDANDNNIVVDGESGQAIVGVIDFGDLCFGRQVNELAVTLAYALMDVEDIYASAEPLIGAYAGVFRLLPEEAELLFDLVAVRLAASVCISSHRAKEFPDNEYLRISQAPALRLLGRLDRTLPRLLAAFARYAAGLNAVATHDAVVHWLASDDCRPHALFTFDLQRSCRSLVSLRDGSADMQHVADPAMHWRAIKARMAADDARFAIGLYAEDRSAQAYAGAQFAGAASGERRTRHLGLDFFAAQGTPVHAPLAGKVLGVADNAKPFDYGPTVILEHDAGAQGPKFWTLYGHLSRESIAALRPGMTINAGQVIAEMGAPTENGGWAPHVHFQLITDHLDQNSDFPGACEPSLWPIWRRISPDPNLLLKLAPERFIEDTQPPEALLARRARLLPSSMSISYQRPLKIVRGRGAYLYDHTGRAFLDGVNNICHVGHSHPHVVAALSKQAALLNTNTRYLHNTILDYAERLGRTFPAPLSVVYLVCSGSEANELALRIARTVTGRRHSVVLDWGYHGNTNAAIDLSAYKFKRKGGRGKPDEIEIATLPDPYRGPIKGYAESTAIAYAQSVQQQIAAIHERTGQGPAAFIAEAISGCGGQVIYPEKYLAHAARHVRAAGGLVIVDEVQTGFGRVGDHFWAHAAQGVVPDIVTLGKPIGNGHPMAAVVTTPEIAHAFANGMEFFSSFGGNPVSTAVGMAVLDVIENEDLQRKAQITGTHLMTRLGALADRHTLIGDVRGRGLFIGVELVLDRQTLAPATEPARAIANRLRDLGVLISTDGPFDNVLKIKPPLAFGLYEADLLADTLDQALAEVCASPRDP